MLRLLTLVLPIAFLGCLTSATIYDLKKNISGLSFFDDWDFFDGYDSSTEGDEIYLGEQAALSASLAYVDSSKHAFIRVDNTTNVPFNDKRNSVKITTKESYGMGTVWAVDVFHAPYGCGVWPAIWSWAPQVGSRWPTGGEIDIFEAVNQDAFSYASLHTEQTCTASQLNPNQSISSTVNSTKCDGPSGCITVNTGFVSYGPSFNNLGGGMYVTEFADTGISLWFFARDNIPPFIYSSRVNTSSLGTPVANWPSSICGSNGFNEVFLPQSLVINIALCGNLGRAQYNATCPAGSCYTSTVIGNGSNFAEAYFEIGSVQIFTTNDTATFTNTEGNKSDSKGVIIGSTLGGFFGLLLLCSGVFIVYKTKKSTPRPEVEEEWPAPAPFIADPPEHTVYNPMFSQPLTNSKEKSDMSTNSGDLLPRSPTTNTLSDFSTGGSATPRNTATLLRELDSLRRELAEVRASGAMEPPPTYSRTSDNGH